MTALLEKATAKVQYELMLFLGRMSLTQILSQMETKPKLCTYHM